VPESGDQMAATLAHEGTHVRQDEIADKVNYHSALGDSWASATGSKPTEYRGSYASQLQKERQAYTAQYDMERKEGVKGSIYDPTHPNANVSSQIEVLATKSAVRGCTSQGDWICSN
jgi:hypothetical protein